MFDPNFIFVPDHLLLQTCSCIPEWGEILSPWEVFQRTKLPRFYLVKMDKITLKQHIP